MVPGLHKAPITKALLVIFIGSTVLGLSNRLRGQLDIGNRAKIFPGGEWWRIVTSLMASDGLADGIISWMLIYWFRTFEKQMGSGKFAMFISLAAVWAALTRVGLLAGWPALGGLASGPYELIFALFVYYFKAVPRLVPAYFTLGRLRFSDKTLTYVVGLQLLFNSGFRSALLGLSGLVFGGLYMADVAWMSSRWRLPVALRSLFARWILPLWESESPHAAEARRAAALQARADRERQLEELEMQQAMAQIAALQGQGGMGMAGAAGARGGTRAMRAAGGAGSAATGGGGSSSSGATARRQGPVASPRQAVDGAALAAALQAATGSTSAASGAQAAATSSDVEAEMLPASAVDAAAVDRLVAMGFGRDESVLALRRAFNDETAAADRLLEGM